MTIPGKKISFRNGGLSTGKGVKSNDGFGYMSNENFVKPFLEALHKTILIVNFPRNGKLYIMQKIAHMQAAVHNSGECQAFAPDCGIYFSPISGLLCIMNETQLVSRQIKMQD